MTVQEQTKTSEVLQYEVDDGIATIWLNRPEVKNCVNWELLVKLGEALERAEDDDDARVVVIRGRGLCVLGQDHVAQDEGAARTQGGDHADRHADESRKA